MNRSGTEVNMVRCGRIGDRSRIAGIVPLVLLAGCTGADMRSDTAHTAGSLRVTLVEDYYWPGSAGTGDPNGEAIEVFPLVTALVVDSRDGRPLADQDEAAARDAAGAYCRARGGHFPAEASARLSEGAWAFPPCWLPVH